MSKQKTDLIPNANQKRILKLEKEYFDKLESIITSKDFLSDLKNVERETKTNYRLLSKIWNVKNKIKIPAERLVRYHIYKTLFNTDMGCSFFPSPVSCDLAVETDDAILNIDVKTDDIQGNRNDIYNTQLEHNQSSFNNRRIGANGPFKGLEAMANLKPIDEYSGKINLTYLIKIIYSDDGYNFEISSDKNNPTLTLTCIPNGILSELFDFDLLSNFKTYKYYTELDGEYYKEKLIGNNSIFNNTNDEKKYEIIEDNINIPEHWIRGKVLSKVGYYDPDKDTVWLYQLKGSSNKKYYLCAVRCGDSSRYKSEWLKDRYDENGNLWEGLKEYYEMFNNIK